MAISYKKLWKLLIDRDIKKMKLKKMVEISNGTLARLGKNEPVSLDVLEKICVALNCDIGSIMEFIPSEEGGEE